MKAIFAVLTVLVLAESSFAFSNSTVNSNDPNTIVDREQRALAVSPANACKNRLGKSIGHQFVPGGEGRSVETRTANGARAGSNI